MGGCPEEGTSLVYTPTWVVASVCTVFVAISLALERGLHHMGKFLKKKNQKPLYEALLKVQEELMLLGFISLLLTVSQSFVVKICVNPAAMTHLLPCALPSEEEEEPAAGGYCAAKSQVPLLPVEALHQLHNFIFFLAIVHVVYSVLTALIGIAKIREWKKWEDSIVQEKYGSQQALRPMVTHVHENEFIKKRFTGFGKGSAMGAWMVAFFKQFHASVTEADYTTLRHGFIMMHCRGNPKFNFHNYVMRALEDDFKKVVGIHWLLWVFVVIFLLLNIDGWHLYFWLAFLPLVLLLAVGAKLEHVITRLAHEVAERNVAVEGELVVQPSDDHFWFNRPQLVLKLIHFILFQNAFEIAFTFWVWVQFGFQSCIMGRLPYIIVRLVVAVFIQVLCSHSTLPLYALVTQMGTHFKKVIFDEHVQVSLVGWAQNAKKKKGLAGASFKGGSFKGSFKGGSSDGIQIDGTGRKDASTSQA